MSVQAIDVIDDDDDNGNDANVALEEPEGPKKPEAAFQPAKTEARKELPEADPPKTVSDHVNLALTDQFNAIYGLCEAVLPLLLAQEAQDNFVRDLDAVGVRVPTFQELHRDRRRNRIKDHKSSAIQVRVSSVMKQARVTADEPVLVDYSSSAYRPVPGASELDLLDEEEEQVHMISLKEQASLELGMFADWGNNTESALAATNDKHRLFKYASRVSQFRECFGRMPAHVRASFLSDDPHQYFTYALRETPLPKPFLNKEMLENLLKADAASLRAAGLIDGDILHVPFNNAEVDILMSLLPLTKESNGVIARRLPGRTAIDALRFLEQRIRHTAHLFWE
eukprot:TRINITY_DN1284_c1_g1_i1.p1 TRINITY_DN1284_c1_g1~~TRINITY_DN1284_c1_g1_i1.p1  ORF type:complete len:339 (+),score=53.58 TRINITY_DN1284_c1_g1_i1:505-1521(+)